MCIVCECEEKKDFSPLKGLKELDCSDCPLITEIPNILGLEKLYCYRCPWLNYSKNPNYNSNIRKLKKLQAFTRRNFRYFVIKHFLESEACAKWFYDPDNFGGYKSKLRAIANYS